ncbi:XRE family transcriptional regulator [Amycolatopsis sp. Poz14]|uniref:XRE family transcriptional regulator n=1 Tax=Amycolatopsis sp. Poz14 TaxID=1447705 RepID=UPI001EE81A2E|nr:XRE family transcriptional regulator [Amycolatopsis sp. Poz14]MCG3755764.1 XRE family transcriptional regulator [Amycolatopsis sp. Poz14]
MISLAGVPEPPKVRSYPPVSDERRWSGGYRRTTVDVVPSFADALDAAISGAGLTLDRLREHLAARGVTVSRSALAYWRTGRSLPGRETSLHAVVELEQVLGLGAGRLTSLLGPQDRQGSRPQRTPLLERRRLWPSVRPSSLEFDLPPEDQVRLRSVHDELLVDDDRQERLLRVRVVAEAAVDGVVRMAAYYQTEDRARQPPRFAAGHCCRAGRTRVDAVSGLLIAELFFDRELRAGEVAAVEYEFVFPYGRPVQGYHRRLTRPAPLYTCRVQFGSDIPESVRRFEQRDLAAPRRKVEELRAAGSGAVTLAARDVGAGIIGVEWTW